MSKNSNRGSTFKHIAHSEFDWYLSAKRLRTAAEHLWAAIPPAERTSAWPSWLPENMKRSTVFYHPLGPYLLLIAFALENLIKGLLIRDDPTLVQPGKRGEMTFGSKIRTHDLTKLATEPYAPSTDEERAFLLLLYHASVAYGRYPLPVDHTHDAWIGPEGPVDGSKVARMFEVVFERWATELTKSLPGDPED